MRILRIGNINESLCTSSYTFPQYGVCWQSISARTVEHASVESIAVHNVLICFQSLLVSLTEAYSRMLGLRLLFLQSAQRIILVFVFARIRVMIPRGMQYCMLMHRGALSAIAVY